MDVFVAARDGDLERVRAVVELDANLVHDTDDRGWTPLLYAACGGHVEVVRYLLEHGAMVNHRDHDQQTALHWACSEGRAGVVFLLLQRDANVTAAGVWGRSPLMSAATDDIARLLLEHGGSDVDAADDDALTACHWACSGGHSGVLRQLLEAGADPECQYILTDAPPPVRLCLCVDRHNLLQEWRCAYTLYRARMVREAYFIVANSCAPVDAAPKYLVDRATPGLTMPTLHVSPHQQHGQPFDDVGEEGHVEVDFLTVEGVVTVSTIAELNGEVFVELMELLGITGCGAHELQLTSET